MTGEAASTAGKGASTHGAVVCVPIVLAAGVALGLVELVLWPVRGGPGGPPPHGAGPAPLGLVEAFTLFSAVDLALLIALVVVYLRTYRDTRAQFALGLVAFLFVLLFEAIANSPFVFAVFGFGPGPLGPFLAIGAALEMAALALFLVLSLE
jgi:hypothetical protein